MKALYCIFDIQHINLLQMDLKVNMFTFRGMRLSFSMHDVRNPWAGNTNMINGFYEEPENSVEHRYLDAR